MKTVSKISVLGTGLLLMLILDVAPQLLVPDAYAIYGTRRRTARRTAVVVGSASSAQTAQAQQQAAAAEQQAAAAEADATAAEAEAAEAQQQSAAAQQQPTAPPPAPAPAAPPPGALPIGTIVTQLPAGCPSTVINNVEYYSCGGNYYRAAFQGSQLVYVTTQP
jgi:hypothetical protein